MKKYQHGSSFYDFLVEYKKAQQNNRDVLMYGVADVSYELDYQEGHEFQSKRLIAEEDMLFDGTVYFVLDDYLSEIIDEIDINKPESELDEEMKERIQDVKGMEIYPECYAITRFYSLQKEIESNDFVTDELRMEMDCIELYIATDEELGEFVESNAKNIVYSTNYKEFEVLKNEVEEAETTEELYSYYEGEPGKFDHYEEKFYFLPRTNSCYVVALGGPLTKMAETKNTMTYGSKGFSRLTEDEFAVILNEKLKNNNLDGYTEEEFFERHTSLKPIWNKYRLKFLFSNKQEEM